MKRRTILILLIMATLAIAPPVIATMEDVRVNIFGQPKRPTPQEVQQGKLADEMEEKAIRAQEDREVGTIGTARYEYTHKLYDLYAQERREVKAVQAKYGNMGIWYSVKPWAWGYNSDKISPLAEEIRDKYRDKQSQLYALYADRLAKQKKDEENFLWFLLWTAVVVLAVAILGIWLGVKDRVVYYFSWWDWTGSLVPIILAITGFFKHNSAWAWAGLVIAVAYNFYMAHWANDRVFNQFEIHINRIQKSIVGFSRVVTGYLMPALILGTIFGGGESKREGEDATARELRLIRQGVEKAVFTGGLLWLLCCLVNGKRIIQEFRETSLSDYEYERLNALFTREPEKGKGDGGLKAKPA